MCQLGAKGAIYQRLFCPSVKVSVTGVNLCCGKKPFETLINCFLWHGSWQINKNITQGFSKSVVSTITFEFGLLIHTCTHINTHK